MSTGAAGIQEAPKQPETLKTQLLDVFARAVDCKTMAESVRNDLIPSAPLPDKPGPDTPAPTSAGEIVQRTRNLLADAQTALQDARSTLNG